MTCKGFEVLRLFWQIVTSVWEQSSIVNNFFAGLLLCVTRYQVMLIILEMELCRDSTEGTIPCISDILKSNVEIHFMCQNSPSSALGWQEHPAGHLRTVIFWFNCTENILLGSFPSPLETPPCVLTKMHCCSLHRLPER